MRRNIATAVLMSSSSLSPSSQQRQKGPDTGGVNSTDGVVEVVVAPSTKKKLSKVEVAAQRKRDTWRSRTTQFITDQLLNAASSNSLPFATVETTVSAILSTPTPTVSTLSPKDIFMDTAEVATRDAVDKSTTDDDTPAAGFPSGEVVLIHNGGSMCNINPSALLGYLHAHTSAITPTSDPQPTPPQPPRLFVSSSGTFSGVLAPRGGAVSLSRLLQLLHPQPPISSTSGSTDPLDAAGVFKKCTTTPTVAGVFYVDVLRRYVRVKTPPTTSTVVCGDHTSAVGVIHDEDGGVVVDLFALLFPATRLITRGVYPVTTPANVALRGRVICAVPDGANATPCTVTHLGSLPTSSPSSAVSLFAFPDVCPGLYILPNFATPDEEHQLLRYLSAPPPSTTSTAGAEEVGDETTKPESVQEVAEGGRGGASSQTLPPTPKWDFLLGGRKVMHMNRRFIFENNSCGPTVADLLANGDVNSAGKDPWRALVPTHPIVTDILKRLYDAAKTTTSTSSSSTPSAVPTSAQAHLRAALSLQHTKLGPGEDVGTMANFDQLTINEYPPGSGIPSHVDAHHCFHSPILSISLGARECVMNLREPKRLVNDAEPKCVDDEEKVASSTQERGRRAATQPRDSNVRGVDVFLPRGSLLILSGPARYAYTHGIDDKVFHTVGGEVMGNSESPTTHQPPTSPSDTRENRDMGYIFSGGTPFADPNVRFSISCRAAKVVPGCEDCQAPHVCDGVIYSSQI